MSGQQPGSRQDARWDRLAEELQGLRRRVGDPSYAEIARQVSERRVADGAAPHSARVARTTVYDAFRTGRARVNLALVREIVSVLGGTDEQVEEWIATATPAPAPVPDPEPDPEPVARPARPARRLVLLLLAACVVVNITGRVFVDLIDVPIYLDMLGTAIAAIALGPWHGAAVGATTNLLGVASSGPDSMAFGLVNVAGALVWGYGVRRFGLGRTLPRFFTLNLLVAAVCTAIAVPILVLLFGGTTGHGEDSLREAMSAVTETAAMAVGVSNLLVSLADKVISGFVALVAVSALPVALRAGVELPLPAVEPAARTRLA